MRRLALVWMAVCSLLALSLAGGAAWGFSRPLPTPEPTPTLWVLTITQQEFVVITATPEPTRYTIATYRDAQRAGTAPTAVVIRPTPFRGAVNPADVGVFVPTWRRTPEGV